MKLWDKIKGFFYKNKQEVDIERVFKQFQEEIDNKKEGELMVIGENMTENPILWLGMFKKIVLNHVNFINQIEKYLKEEEIDIPEEELNKAGEFVVFSRAWYYISNIHLYNKMDIDAIKLVADAELLFSLKTTIKFFEFIEDYEKCSFLKRIQDEVKISLARDVPS